MERSNPEATAVAVAAKRILAVGSLQEVKAALGERQFTVNAIACSDRPVINLQGDGSAMYTVQALWTHAREPQRDDAHMF